MRRLGATAAALVCLALVGFAPEQFDPFPRKDVILKTFADEFVPLTPGSGKYPKSFARGSKASGAEMPIREVTIAYPFAMAAQETTQELYQVVMGVNPAKWKGPRNSVEFVTFTEAQTFCEKATALLRQAKLLGAGERVRLPSEAEWEYACRAGTTTIWSFGDDPKLFTAFGWYRDNSEGHDPPVGMKKANPWGLFDMHGYNWEWCADDWAADYAKAPTDGSPHVGDGKRKVIRGGAWPSPLDATRSAYREPADAARRDDTIGFRCVKVAVQP